MKEPRGEGLRKRVYILYILCEKLLLNAIFECTFDDMQRSALLKKHPKLTDSAARRWVIGFKALKVSTFRSNIEAQGHI